jgi:lipoprotein-releasing system ATP-binding protein
LAGAVPVTLVKNIDFAVQSGEFIAITGPSGSGKSSLMYLLGLLDVPSEGDVILLGESTRSLDENRRAALRLANIGFVFQFHFLLPEFTVLDNVMLPMQALGRLTTTEQRARASALLASLGLANHLNKRPEQLSGGERQRVAIARALANEPALILADEPTGNLDTAASEQVITILKDIAGSDQRSVIIVTHDLSLAARANRRVNITDGQIDGKIVSKN